MKRILQFTIGAIAAISILALGGCSVVRPYPTPILQDIQPSQTAFLVPLVGDTGNQGKFDSEEFLAKMKVATKQIEIPQRWFQTGRAVNSGKWIPSARLIIVERKPVSRLWTKSGEGTSEANQALSAETSDSNSFYAEMTVNAQIDEDDATKFLYRFNNRSLEQVLDSDVRHMVAQQFTEGVAHYTPDEFLKERNIIMNKVRANVIPYFKERGLTITVLGLTGDITWKNAAIQHALDSKFVAEQNKIAAQQQQAQAIAEAASRAKVAALMATAQGHVQQDFEIQKLRLEIEKAKWAKWDGKFPTTVVGGGQAMNFIAPMPGIGK